MGPDGLGLQMQGGTLRPLPPSASTGQMVTVINQVVSRLNDQLLTQVFSDGTTRRLLIGFQEGGFDDGKFDFGIKMSIEGVDVSEADDDQLLFSMSLENWTWRDQDGQLVKEFRNNEGIDSYYNSNGDVVKEFKNETGTDSYFDPASGDNFMQSGVLPDGQGGQIIVKEGNNVQDVFS